MRFKISRYRRLIQAFFLLSFFLLLVFNVKHIELPVPPELFLLFDPLVALVSVLSGSPLKAAFLLSLITVAITLIFGRVYCGYACPMGTLIDMFSPLARVLKLKQGRFHRLTHLPSVVLFVMLIASAFKVGFLTVLDPVVLLTRTSAVTIFPAIDSVLSWAANSLYSYDGVAIFIDNIMLRLAGILIFSESRMFAGVHWIVLPFAMVFALNLLGKRFWCRYLCPLGGLLSLLSKVSLYRRKVDAEACTSCLACSKVCDMEATGKNGSETHIERCMLCMSCRGACPEDAVSWGLDPGFAREMPSRRTAITTIGATVAAAYLLPVRDWPKPDRFYLIRPPGALAEAGFLSKCVRCGECLKVCPSNVLQPAILQFGFDGLWTPYLDFAAGACEYECGACNRVCPTGAIEHLAIKEKQRFVVGLAGIDREKCIPWATGDTCMVCQELCPVPDKAIIIKEEPFKNGKLVQKPYVIKDLCIGCGVCENKCPVEDEKAIRVLNPGMKDKQKRFV